MADCGWQMSEKLHCDARGYFIVSSGSRVFAEIRHPPSAIRSALSNMNGRHT